MQDDLFCLSKVVAFPNDFDRSSRRLRGLIQENEDIRRFFKFVDENDLREEALSLLEARLNRFEE